MHWKLHEICRCIYKTERKEDDLWGTIEMSFNNMWFLDSAPSEWKEIWNNLMKEA